MEGVEVSVTLKELTHLDGHTPPSVDKVVKCSALVLLLVAVATTAWGRVSSEGVAAGTPIVAIEVVRHDVFDTSNPKTSSWPYRAANAIHITSREHFIRSLLLFHVGDPLDPALLAESERLLRATGFLDPVTITARQGQGGAVVVVETRDQWTLEFSLNFGLVGSRKKTGVSVVEDNFLGLGKGVVVDWRSDQERNQVTLGYKDPLFLGTRWRLEADHVEASDGTADDFSLEYPFFALGTKLAGGVEWQRDNLTEWLYVGGKKRVSGDTSTTKARVWGGYRLPGDERVANRVLAGFFIDRASFTDWQYRDGAPYPDPRSRELVGVQVGFEHQVDRWQVARGFRSWRRQEDLPLGPNWKLLVGLSLPALGADRRLAVFDGDVTTAQFGDDRYSWLTGEVSGRADGAGSIENGVLHLETGTATLGDRSWRGRIAVDLGHELDLDRQLTLGADVGLRGWDPDTFDGTKRAVLNLEVRQRLTGELLDLVVLGGTVFVDAGSTWDPRVGASTGGVRADAGIGLIAEITRAASLHVVRLEVGFPDDGSGPLVLVTGGSLF